MSWLDEEIHRKYHPLASLFPLMEGQDFDEFKADIAAHGLLEAIWLHPDGSIIDGRNRHRACIETETEPRFRTWDGAGSLVAFIVSMNLHRRHLTPSQQAAISPKIEKALSEEIAQEKADKARALALKRQAELHNIELTQEEEEWICETIHKPARDALAETAAILNINRHYVSDAKRLQEEAPDLLEGVRVGAYSMPQAKQMHREKKKQEEVTEHTAQMMGLPELEKVYNVIYADVPWDYGGHEYKDAESRKHYAVMSLTDIGSYLDDMDIQVADAAVLFFWATNPHLRHAFEIIDAWGFVYKTNIVWVKTELKKPGVGFYVRGRHELLLICTRGSFTPLDKHIAPPIGSVLQAPIGEHSEKPEEAYTIIERLYPRCVYLELFARKQRSGWVCLGAEAGK